ncbi:LacI family DNA-binding transcriptional regulator [Paenarthrobacter sp. YJN-5]|uniref:LacI family DNA-binding transcriptional regulator n=1 Tax=Paenarthrobacter sp. YJN-5 TaxID=2735316 RepID=UPI001878C5EB|nr:LacI family DNA-binding transcriptional regulator [Paenarthrobacter sp. YJN-5]QOT18573.1 LacI family DNA-binding transcriptional regulator [Paenarthrobacter sp. YJN-5]
MTVETKNRRVTAADVAKSLGISRATVGFVLNNTRGQTISEATRQRVIAEAERLGYRPHTAAQALARGRSRIILLALPDWPVEHSLGRHVAEASRVLEEAGYSLVTYTLHESEAVRPLWEALDPDVVMGLLPFSERDVASMRASGIASIIPDPSSEPMAWQTGPSIVAGPGLQVAHLADLGHRRIAFAAPDDARLTAIVEARFSAVRNKALELGLPTPDRRHLDFHDSSARQAVQQWSASGVTGVVAYNDETAAAVVAAAVREGIPVPGELAVIGHDDTPWAELFVPSLSTIRLDIEGLGRQIAMTALVAVDGRAVPAEDPALIAALVRREST